MANEHKIVQYDELPSWTYTLSFDTDSGTWPPLNADDVVTAIARNGSGAPIVHRFPDAAITRATREVRWDFLSTQTATDGTYKVKTRVTQADGRSYSHPLDGTDTLVVLPAVASTDVTDPA